MSNEIKNMEQTTEHLDKYSAEYEKYFPTHKSTAASQAEWEKAGDAFNLFTIEKKAFGTFISFSSTADSSLLTTEKQTNNA